MAGGVPAVAGLDYYPPGAVGSVVAYEATASRGTRDALQIGGFEPTSRLVANMSNGVGDFTGGAVTVAARSAVVSELSATTRFAPEWLRTAIARCGVDNFVFTSIAQDAEQLAQWN